MFGEKENKGISFKASSSMYENQSYSSDDDLTLKFKKFLENKK